MGKKNLLSQPAFTYSKLTMQISKQCVKSVQSKIRDLEMMSLMSFLLTFNIFCRFFCYVHCWQGNAGWIVYYPHIKIWHKQLDCCYFYFVYKSLWLGEEIELAGDLPACGILKCQIRKRCNVQKSQHFMISNYFNWNKKNGQKLGLLFDKCFYIFSFRHRWMQWAKEFMCFPLLQLARHLSVHVSKRFPIVRWWEALWRYQRMWHPIYLSLQM